MRRWLRPATKIEKSALLILASTATLIMAFASITFGNPISRYTHAEGWANKHGLIIELGSVWAIAVGLSLWGLGKLVAALMLVRTHDRTAVGVSLRWQKASESIGLMTLGSYFWLILADYYLAVEFTVLEQLLIAVVIAIVSIAAAAFGLWFVVALVREVRRRQERKVGYADPDDR